jgi:uncharacterized protein (TIGR02117 family)
MRRVLKILLFPLILILFYILLSFLLLLFPTKSHCIKREKSIYLYADTAHTEIIMPISYFKPEYQQKFPELLKNRSDGYLAFSYGEKEFLMKVPTWEDIKIELALKALFINTPALIRVGYYYDIKKDICTKINLSNSCLKKLNQNIFKSFAIKENHFIRYKDPYKEPNIFYFQAKKSYNLFHTCNSWSGDRLREAGLKASYLTPFAQQVIYPYQKD